MDKSSISIFLIEQAITCLKRGCNSEKRLTIREEIEESININLLLGITLEGVINEIGEKILDKWTWNELEKTNTSLKCRVISGFSDKVTPDRKPLQTVMKFQKIRNTIAHPKPIKNEDDIIIESTSGAIKVNPSDDLPLPPEELMVYIGHEKLYHSYNFKEAQENIIEVLVAITGIIKECSQNESYTWAKDFLKEVRKLNIVLREELK